MRAGALLGGGLLGLALVGPAKATCPGGFEPAREVRVYMGLSIPGGGVVGPEAFQTFLEQEVAPRFPDGLTVLDGEGRWRGASGVAQSEASKVLVLISPPASRDVDKRIQAVRQAYQQRFRQESVLVTSQVLCAAY